MQSDPPTPEDDAVFIQHTDGFTAYVVSYGGFQSEKTITEHAGKLYNKLSSDGVAVDADEYYAVGYDSPFRLMNRHNEVCCLAMLCDAYAADAD